MKAKQRALQRRGPRTIKALRASRAVLTTAVCDECGQQHRRKDRDGKWRPTCQNHVHQEDGTIEACGNWPLKDRHCCIVHGGRTATGPANRFWKHGAYSKYLPTRYKHAFELSLTDPELTSVKYQLALLDAREAELLKRLDTGESGVLWTEIRAAAQELTRAMTSATPNVQQAVANNLVKHLDTWADSESQWSQLYAIFEMRRKLADTERRREEGLNAHLTLDEMTKIAAFLAGMLRRYVPDVKALRSASQELSQFFGLFNQPVNGDAPIIDAEVVEGGEESALAVIPPMPKSANTLNGAVMGMTPLVEEKVSGKRKSAKKRSRK